MSLLKNTINFNTSNKSISSLSLKDLFYIEQYRGVEKKIGGGSDMGRKEVGNLFSIYLRLKAW